MLDIKNVGFLGSLNERANIQFITSIGLNQNSISEFLFTLPTEVQVGDLAVIAYNSYDNDSEQLVSTVPGGWGDIATYASGSSPNFYSQKFLYLIIPVAGTDYGVPGLTTPTVETFDNATLTVLFFRKTNGPISSVSVSPTINYQYTTGTLTQQTLDPTHETKSVIMLASAKATGVSGPTLTSTPSMDGSQLSQNTNCNNRLYYKIYNSSPQSHILSMSDQGTNIFSSFYITVS